MCKVKIVIRVCVLLNVMIGTAAAAQFNGVCEYTITQLHTNQDDAAKRSADGGKAVKSSAAGSSMYWLSQDTLEKRLIEFISLEEKFARSSRTALQAEAKRRLKTGDGRISQFSVSCMGINVLGIGRTWKANEPTIPFKPGSYPIHVNDDSSPLTFSAILSIRDDTPPAAYYVSEAGTIDLQRFDASGASGGFSFVAENRAKTKKIKVEGRFDVPCKGDLCQ